MQPKKELPQKIFLSNMTHKTTHTSKNIEETNRIAKNFVENLLKTVDNCGKLATVIALEGDLGSGKTTFVKAVAETFGIQKTVTSPTFVIEKTYKMPKNERFTHLIHIDAYRLENGTELLTLGWKEITEDPHNIIFIEWPERVAEVLPEGVRTIQFRFVDETTRVLTIID
jgi:tRNA threonylcarbamoyladenosine biosynthesis protein TsaE